MEEKVTNHHKYITIPEFNQLTVENLAIKNDIADLVKKIDFYDKPINISERVTLYKA